MSSVVSSSSPKILRLKITETIIVHMQAHYHNTDII